VWSPVGDDCLHFAHIVRYHLTTLCLLSRYWGQSFRIDYFGNSPEYTLPVQPAFTRVLDRSQDNLLRDSGWVLGSTPASGVGGGATPPPELVTSYSYNPTDGRLSSISNPQLSNVSFGYTYVPKSNLIATITGPAHVIGVLSD